MTDYKNDYIILSFGKRALKKMTQYKGIESDMATILNSIVGE